MSSTYQVDPSSHESLIPEDGAVATAEQTVADPVDVPETSGQQDAAADGEILSEPVKDAPTPVEASPSIQRKQSRQSLGKVTEAYISRIEATDETGGNPLDSSILADQAAKLAEVELRKKELEELKILQEKEALARQEEEAFRKALIAKEKIEAEEAAKAAAELEAKKQRELEANLRMLEKMSNVADFEKKKQEQQQLEEARRAAELKEREAEAFAKLQELSEIEKRKEEAAKQEEKKRLSLIAEREAEVFAKLKDLSELERRKQEKIKEEEEQRKGELAAKEAEAFAKLKELAEFEKKKEEALKEEEERKKEEMAKKEAEAFAKLMEANRKAEEEEAKRKELEEQRRKEEEADRVEKLQKQHEAMQRFEEQRKLKLMTPEQRFEYWQETYGLEEATRLKAEEEEARAAAEQKAKEAEERMKAKAAERKAREAEEARKKAEREAEARREAELALSLSKEEETRQIQEAIRSARAQFTKPESESYAEPEPAAQQEESYVPNIKVETEESAADGNLEGFGANDNAEAADNDQIEVRAARHAEHAVVAAIVAEAAGLAAEARRTFISASTSIASFASAVEVIEGEGELENDASVENPSDDVKDEVPLSAANPGEEPAVAMEAVNANIVDDSNSQSQSDEKQAATPEAMEGSYVMVENDSAKPAVDSSLSNHAISKAITTVIEETTAVENNVESDAVSKVITTVVEETTVYTTEIVEEVEQEALAPPAEPTAEKTVITERSLLSTAASYSTPEEPATVQASSTYVAKEPSLSSSESQARSRRPSTLRPLDAENPLGVPAVVPEEKEKDRELKSNKDEKWWEGSIKLPFVELTVEKSVLGYVLAGTAAAGIAIAVASTYLRKRR
ncbi:hypothetical protein HDU96_000227 [Phlyctochytrium bullatum]|nr:hypothetical protein HDU96_000227 [Phlyctochytrium bullatum]